MADKNVVLIYSSQIRTLLYSLKEELSIQYPFLKIYELENVSNETLFDEIFIRSKSLQGQVLYVGLEDIYCQRASISYPIEMTIMPVENPQYSRFELNYEAKQYANIAEAYLESKLAHYFILLQSMIDLSLKIPFQLKLLGGSPHRCFSPEAIQYARQSHFLENFFNELQVNHSSFYDRVLWSKPYPQFITSFLKVI